MTTRGNTKVVGLVVVFVFVGSFVAEAGMWNKMTSWAFWARKWPETLIVTGNYAKPRLLAEQAQDATDLPVILISQESGADEVYYMPEGPEAMKIQNSKYLEFIEVMIRPQRVVVLGNGDYVPEDYVDVLKTRYPTIVISGEDWIKNAEQLGKIVGSRWLAGRYRKNLMKLLESEAHEPQLQDFTVSD